MNFKKLEKKIKMQHFQKCVKIYLNQNFICLMFYKSDRPVCNHLNVNFIYIYIKLLSKPFALEKVDFCICNPKTLK